MEHWKPVKGYEGCYEISNHGNVRRIRSTAFEHRKISEADVPAIIAMAKVKSYRAVAKSFGVSDASIRKVVHGKTFQYEPHLLKLTLDSKGYPFVVLCRGGKTFQMRVHRLVAEAFIGDGRGLQVNHKDGRRNNNHLSNLEYVTASGNQVHRIEILGRTQKLTREMVNQIRQAKGKRTKKSLASEYGVSIHTIASVWCRGSWDRD